MLIAGLYCCIVEYNDIEGLLASNFRCSSGHVRRRLEKSPFCIAVLTVQAGYLTKLMLVHIRL